MPGTPTKGKRTDAWLMEPEDVTVIAIDTSDGPEHALYHEKVHRPLSEETIQNYMEVGPQLPVLARRVGELIVVTDGRRRVLYTREANRRLRKAKKPTWKIKLVFHRGSDDEAMGLSITTNEHREDDTLLERAARARRYYERCGDLGKVALHFRVTAATIRNWVALDEAPQPVKEEVAKGTITATSVARLARVPQEKRETVYQELLQEAAAGRRPTVKATESKARSARKNTSAASAKSKSSTAANGHVAPGRKAIKAVLRAEEADDGPKLRKAVREALRWVLTGDPSHAEAAGIEPQ